MSNNLDYLKILKAIQTIPFSVGKKLLIDYLQGNEKNKSITNNHLNKQELFGSLSYEKEELENLINNLIINGLIELTSIKGKKYWKVLQLTEKGKKEIENPQLYQKKISFKFKETITKITEQDKQIFQALGPELQQYNDEQKKAIICNAKKILCIAGAGSGKTTALTKRIEFLIKYRSINPQKILAITFTRKARQEMINRTKTKNAHIHTFNSFCEQTLKKHNNKIYNKTVNVMNYQDKIKIVHKALQKKGLDMKKAINTYFTYAQQRTKTSDQLARTFINDCFFIRDYFKFKNKKITKEKFQTTEHQQSANLIYTVSNFIEEEMNKQGLRDFADQLIDTLKLFKQFPETIPKFEHILIDEYQDINSTQIKLIDVLNPKNLFCVGDPRQSIYGWRGSDIKYILNFKEKYPEAEILTLTKNYRSTKQIVNLINESIKAMQLPNLETTNQESGKIELLPMKNEQQEQTFITNKILSSKIPRQEIFILARTNKQLKKLSEHLKQHKIKHIVKTDEMKKSIIAKEGEITLSTIHSIKGLEAELVFIIGCTTQNFPCKTTDHPIIDLIKINEYDKEEEEKRLFYVAMSRAKKKLYLTYTGKKPTYYITTEMQKIINPHNLNNFKQTKNLNNTTIDRLKEWRKELSQKLNIPAYCILHDSTLIQISTQQPQTLEDLELIRGMGPTKIIKYGEQILNTIK